MKKGYILITIAVILISIVVSIIISNIYISRYSFENITFIGLDKVLYNEEIVEVSITSAGTPVKTVFKDEDLINETKGLFKDVLLKYKDSKKGNPGVPWQVTIKTGKSEYSVNITGFEISKDSKNYICNKNLAEEIRDIFEESERRNGSEKMY